MKDKKISNILLNIDYLITGLIFIVLNVIWVYPLISCFYAPYAFWLLAIIGVAGGILLFFDVRLFRPEDN